MRSLKKRCVRVRLVFLSRLRRRVARLRLIIRLLAFLRSWVKVRLVCRLLVRGGSRSR